MAKRPSTLVGLEIEPSAVRAVTVSSSGRPHAEHAASVPLAPGVVRDGEVADPEALSEALTTLFADAKGLDKRVRVGIANQKIVLRVIELPPITNAKELESAVRFQAQDQIPMPLDAAVLDFQALDVIPTDNGPRQRIALVAARRDMVDKVLAAVRGAGLRPEGLDLAAFGMIRALHAPGTADVVIYVSVGGLTNLAVAQGTTCLFTRVVGGGLEGLAVEHAERHQLTLDEARRELFAVGVEQPVELMDGDAQRLEDARTVLLDGVRRISVDIRNSVDFHQAQALDPAHAGVARCVLAGPAVGVPGFASALSAELGLPVESGVPGEDGAYAVATGLALEEARS